QLEESHPAVHQALLDEVTEQVHRAMNMDLSASYHKPILREATHRMITEVMLAIGARPSNATVVSDVIGRVIAARVYSHQIMQSEVNVPLNDTSRSLHLSSTAIRLAIGTWKKAVRLPARLHIFNTAS